MSIKIVQISQILIFSISASSFFAFQIQTTTTTTTKMSALDQSLDEIISSKPKRSTKSRPQARGKGVSKQVTKPKASAKKTPTGPKPAPVVDASYATKVIVYGLPKDIKQDAIKDFFSSQVGGVQTIALTYNERGQSKGIATIIFKTAANAAKAVEKYNGAPIDGGKTKLKLELIVDPTKKPLATRILANQVSQNTKAKAKEGPKKKGPTAEKKKVGAKPAGKPKSKRPAKKSLEQLDQEMADYFEKKD